MIVDDIPGIQPARHAAAQSASNRWLMVDARDGLNAGAELVARAVWSATLLTAVELLRNAGIDAGWHSAQRYLTDLAAAVEPVWLPPGEDHTGVRMVHDVGHGTRLIQTAQVDTGSNAGNCTFCDDPISVVDGVLVSVRRELVGTELTGRIRCYGRTPQSRGHESGRVFDVTDPRNPCNVADNCTRDPRCVRHGHCSQVARG